MTWKMRGKNGELEQKSQEDTTEDNFINPLGKLNDQPSNALYTSGIAPQKILRSTRTTADMYAIETCSVNTISVYPIFH